MHPIAEAHLTENVNYGWKIFIFRHRTQRFSAVIIMMMMMTIIRSEVIGSKRRRVNGE